MTPDEENIPSTAAVAPTTALSPNEGAADGPLSSPKGFIAALINAANPPAAALISIRVRDPADAKMPETSENDGNAMDIEQLDEYPSQSENLPSPSQGGIIGMDVVDVPAAIGRDTITSEAATATTLSLETINPPLGEGHSPKYVVDNGEEILVWEEGTLKDDHVDQKQGVVEITKSSVGKPTEARLGQELENALRSLQKRVSRAITAHKNNDGEMTKNKSAYEKLRNAASKAYHSLVMYGSSIDLSSRVGKDDDGFLEEGRRSRLLQCGRNLWMNIRNHPEIFHDSTSSGDKLETDIAEKDRAIASGYLRGITARLVLLNYIDTRCSIGVPPELCKCFSIRSESNESPSLQELEFGLKLFLRAGRAILENNRQDARASYDLLSLSASCFDSISTMADNGSGEAVIRLKDMLDEAFDASSMLPSAASLFGETCHGNAKDGHVITWQILVIKSLERAELLVDRHCNVSTTSSLHSFFPSLARLCYKHGSHFVKLKEYERASKALHITLKSTNSCLTQIRKQLKQVERHKPRAKQVLHNLEAELVVVSIEAFYLLNITYQSIGDKDKALVCLDRVEEYMKEQHIRDLELHSNAITTLNNEEGIVFAEGSGNSAIEGPRSHFEKDKADIKNRAQTALEDARRRHSTEKATLAFSRIMTFHKTLPSPSSEEESAIDQMIRELVELSLDFTQNQYTSVGSKTNGHNDVFSLALHAIRLVHKRRITFKESGTVGSHTDNYKYLLGKLPKSHFRRPFVMIDKLNTMLAIEYQVREQKFNIKTINELDTEAIENAKDLLTVMKSFVEKSTSTTRLNDTTLFATATYQPLHELLEQAKILFARAISLYHVSDAHELCAQWADLLHSILQMEHKSRMTLTDSDVMLGQVMTVKAYALSMSGDLDSGRQAARNAWEKIKTVDSMVTLFHCSLRYEVKNHSGDTVLEFEAALNELLSPSIATDAILAAFPRLSNSCAENKGSDLILLRVQERWIDLILNSKLCQLLKEQDDVDAPEFTLFDIVRAYLSNFEHVIFLAKDLNATVTHFETLERIIDGLLKLLVHLREARQQKKSGRRKKRKSEVTTDTTKVDEKPFTLVWDDQTVNRLVGDRNDCVWIVEQLWNIGNHIMSVGFVTSGVGDQRGIAANVFAASHDFCLMSDEEVGQSLSKGFLDFDVKFDPTKSVLPIFGQANDRPSCDISSEFSAQCLLVSGATAVDYASECMMKSKSGSLSLQNDVQILLGRSLHRLAQAQVEMQLNCEDEKQRFEVNKMIVLLALRCLLGVGEDSLAAESLQVNGLYAALVQIHLDELSASSSQNETISLECTFVSLRNVKLMADLAEERNMHQTTMLLQRLCSHQLSQSGKFVLDLGDYEISLGEVQRKSIQSSSSTKDVLDVYDEINELVKKSQNEGKKRIDGTFYSMNELKWFAKDANNRAVEHDLLGDYKTAARLFATALNLLPHCGREMQCHASTMNTAYQQIISRMDSRGDSLFSV